MKTAHNIEKHELPEDILQTFEPIIEKLAFELAGKYQESLRLNGMYMPALAFEKLVSKLESSMSIKVAFASVITPKKIEDWDIDILPEVQTRFEVIEPELVSDPNAPENEVIFAEGSNRLLLGAGENLKRESEAVNKLLENLQEPISDIPAAVLFDMPDLERQKTQTEIPNKTSKKRGSGKKQKPVFIKRTPETVEADL
ncbi:TPA: hypothetical protein HA338_06235 [Methanosarcina acetivorans]|uniref:Uncharacterized protein n=1 Tax=Methanosarcina acetivorans TaxID=2214 RepID=A0A832SFQ2_9EURY|nr:hypothetical protein [Methanosarcina acetivorans]HIH93639.1 hypothetical protein [Methanosarcina acetivorans]